VLEGVGRGGEEGRRGGRRGGGGGGGYSLARCMWGGGGGGEGSLLASQVCASGGGSNPPCQVLPQLPIMLDMTTLRTTVLLDVPCIISKERVGVLCLTLQGAVCWCSCAPHLVAAPSTRPDAPFPSTHPPLPPPLYRYADLCSDLGKELPSFPPAEGDVKPITFKRVLLNTCQDEFEAAEDARRVSRGGGAHVYCGGVCMCVGRENGGGGARGKPDKKVVCVGVVVVVFEFEAAEDAGRGGGVGVNRRRVREQ